VLVGAFFTYRQVQTSRRQLEVAQQSQVTERFTRAIDQLGHENLDIRLGGIYALERIANDSPQDRGTVAEVLTAFVRGHAPWPPRHAGQYIEDAPIEDVPPLQARAQDVQAAMTVLGRRKSPEATGLDLTDADLRHAELGSADLRRADLRGAQLQEADLHWARLDGANLDRANLQGAFLNNASLQGANLIQAELQDAQCSDTYLAGAILLGAQLQGAYLVGAELRQALLEHADLQDARMHGVDLEGARLDGARLKGAYLGGADLSAADLTGAHLQGAECNAETVWPDGFNWKAAGVKLEDKRSS
jgi:uncharacterized protein YjbI with pentapeptide repeats